MGSIIDRKLLDECKAAVKTTRTMLKKHGSSLDDGDRAKIEEAADSLQSAIEDPSNSGIAGARAELVDLFEKHLLRYRKSTLREYVESIAWAVVIAMILRTFVIEPFQIPSGSMIPTLLVGDHIFANKFTYGFKIPYVFTKFLAFNNPKRGEIVVFIKPDDTSKDFIKRVIGVEGDTIEIKGRDLFINGEKQPLEKTGAFTYSEYNDYLKRNYEISSDLYIETIGGIRHQVLYREDYPKQPDAVYKVDPGTLFVMGDNRDNSSDSRVWGLVPLTHVKGKAMFIWWSWGQGGLKTSRLFNWVR